MQSNTCILFTRVAYLTAVAVEYFRALLHRQSSRSRCHKSQVARDPQVLLLELGSPAEFLDKAIEPPPPKMLRAALRNLYDLQVREQYGEVLF